MGTFRWGLQPSSLATSALEGSGWLKDKGFPICTDNFWRVCDHIYVCVCVCVYVCVIMYECACICWFNFTSLCIWFLYRDCCISSRIFPSSSLWLLLLPMKPLAGWEQAHFFPDHNKTYEGYCEAFAWLQSSPFHPACRIKQISSGFEDSWKLMVVFACFCDFLKLRGGDNPSNAAPPCSARGTSRGCLVERWLFSTGLHGRRRRIEGSQSQCPARISESWTQRDAYYFRHDVDREKYSHVMARDRDRSCKGKCVHCSTRLGSFRF